MAAILSFLGRWGLSLGSVGIVAYLIGTKKNDTPPKQSTFWDKVKAAWKGLTIVEITFAVIGGYIVYKLVRKYIEKA